MQNQSTSPEDRQFSKFKEEVGKRIKALRESRGWTQQRLAEELKLSNDSRQTVNKWEHGTTPPTLKNLLKLCQLFDCDIGYLFCEYDCKTREATDIQEVTGLSEENISWLSRINNTNDKYAGVVSLDLINYILSNSDFWNKLNDRLPVYLTCLDYRGTEMDTDITRYTIMRAFEELLDGLCDNIMKSNLPLVELDETTPFPSQKIKNG